MLLCVDFYLAEEEEEQLERYFKEPSEGREALGGVEGIPHSVVINEKHEEFLGNKMENIVRKVPELGAKVDEVAQGWKIKRMGGVDLAILRLAFCKVLYDDEVPGKVAINEAAGLVKEFRGNKSPAFINGVLAKLVQG